MMTYSFVCSAMQKAVYEVNIKCQDQETFDAFLAWLKDEHIADMLKLPGFESASVMTQIAETWADFPENAGVHKQEIVALYELTDEAALKAYLEQHAPKMRGLLPEKFRQKVKFHRRMLTRQF